jgi:ATP-dependent helicase/nuclease subunit A
MATAVTPLDWLIPALTAALGEVVYGSADPAGNRPLFDVHLYEPEDMASWSVEGPPDSRRAAMLRVVTRGKALPPDEPLAPDDAQVEQVLSRSEYVYPSLAVTSVRAAIGASELKGAYDFTREPDQREDSARAGGAFPSPSPEPTPVAPGTAAHRGIITHRVLQHLDFSVAVDESGVASELQRMAAEGLISTEDRDAVDAASIEWFVSTPLAAKIRAAGDAYRREFQYIATESPSYFDPSIGATPADEVLVRGIVDGILPADDGIEIVDFKTDAVSPAEVPERLERYRAQMAAYACAMSRIWRRPVRSCRLVFLTARKVVELQGVV